MSKAGSQANHTTGHHARHRQDSALLFLARLASEFTTVPSLPILLDRVMLAINEETAFGSCSLALLDERNPDTLAIHEAPGPYTNSRGHTLPRGKGPHGIVMASGMPLLISDMRADPRIQRRDPKVRSGLYAPLVVDGRAVGVLSAHSAEPNAFTEADLSLLTIVARYITGAIEITRLHTYLNALAATDALTKLANRRSYLDRLAAELARGRRAHRVLSVAVLDLDGFRMINDVHGHATGDALLVQMAHNLTRGLRASDLVARVGSDEFALLLPETSCAQAQKLVSRLHALAVVIPHQQYDGSRISFSYGVATWPKDAHTLEGLLRAAEARLWAMKHDGKGAGRAAKGRETAGRSSR